MTPQCPLSGRPPPPDAQSSLSSLALTAQVLIVRSFGTLERKYHYTFSLLPTTQWVQALTKIVSERVTVVVVPLVQSPQKGGSGQTGLIRVIASRRGELACWTSLGQYARDRGMPDIYSYQKLATKAYSGPDRCLHVAPLPSFISSDEWRPGGDP